jgi:hypothetical protein
VVGLGCWNISVLFWRILVSESYVVTPLPFAVQLLVESCDLLTEDLFNVSVSRLNKLDGLK